jgi:signal transduction histidine kinase
MTGDDRTGEGLAFFGRVSAVVSHELKNIMATISETAGLLGDLVELAGEGRPLEPGELRSISETIMDEIQRGYASIGRLNAFAHSVDQPFEEVELSKIVNLAVGLSQALAYARRVELDPAPAAEVKLHTNSFSLIDLLYNCLVWSYESVGLEGVIRVAVRPRDKTCDVVLSGLGAVETGPGDRIAAATEVVGAVVSRDASRGELTVTIPHEREGS